MELSKNGQKILDLVKDLSVVELNDLVKAMEEEFGVSAAPVMLAGAATAGAEGGDDGEEKDSYNVELTEMGQQKIAVIKVVKEKLGVGLKDAKDMVEKAHTILKEGMKSDDAETFKNELEAAGATVTLK